MGSETSTGGTSHRVPGNMEDLEPGMMVGEYRIEGLLGEGGMGRVYSATHPVIAKRAAIKVLHPELSVNRDAVERFVQEARSVNQIGHPNIVDIFAFGALPDGRSYFVMEWLRGESLRDRMRRSPLAILDSLAILETITVALEAAHEKGVVHRDLKPDNIFLVDVKGTAPTVKLLDFGIAKLLGTDSDRLEKTATGNLLGTPAYISPEQARGQYVDHRTDIYALGALMYELVTGWLPFPADSAADMIAKHLLQDPPHAIDKNPSVPRELDALILASLAKDPNHRPTLEQIRQLIVPLRRGVHGQGILGGGPPMHTPRPAQLTPSISGAAAIYQTPPSGFPMVGYGPQTNMANAVGTTTNVPPPQPRSKLPLFLGALVLIGGTTAAVMFATSKSQTPAPPVTQPGVSLPIVEPKPAPIDAMATEPVAVPGDAPGDAMTVEVKPEDPQPVIKKPGGKKPGGKKPGGKKLHDKPRDDDDDLAL